MTMTKDEINELIENLFAEPSDKIKQALTEYRDSLDKFDVLQHLRDGGKIRRDWWDGDDYIQINNDGIILNALGGDFTLVGFIYNYNEWQAYEVTVEDMLEDGGWYLCEWVQGSDGDRPVILNWHKQLKTWEAPKANGNFHSCGNNGVNYKPILRDGKPIKVEVQK